MDNKMPFHLSLKTFLPCFVASLLSAQGCKYNYPLIKMSDGSYMARLREGWYSLDAERIIEKDSPATYRSRGGWPLLLRIEGVVKIERGDITPTHHEKTITELHSANQEIWAGIYYLRVIDKWEEIHLQFEGNLAAFVDERKVWFWRCPKD